MNNYDETNNEENNVVEPVQPVEQVQPEQFGQHVQHVQSRGMYSNIYPEDFYRENVTKLKDTKKKKKKGVFGKVVLTIALGIVFGGFAGLSFVAVERLEDYLSPEQELSTTPTMPELEEQGVPQVVSMQTSYSVADVVDDVMPAVVSISSEITVQGSFFGQMIEETQESAGSGIIIGENDKELLIVTNYHVVQDSSKLGVLFIDDTFIPATIKGSDIGMDLAVIAVSLDDIPNETKSQIAIAKLGDSDALQVGEPAIAIGNALGYGQSVTTGVISALNRSVEMDDTNIGSSNDYLIQTDAAINLGNSGGALLNAKGEVIGINSNKIGGSLVEGMGYAIPISVAKPILEDLMIKETRYQVATDQRGFMGVNGFQVTSDISQMYGIPEGLYLKVITEGSPAATAGLKVGDILTSFDGVEIQSMEQLVELVSYYEVGETVELGVSQLQQQGYEDTVMEIVLTSRPVE